MEEGVLLAKSVIKKKAQYNVQLNPCRHKKN